MVIRKINVSMNYKDRLEKLEEAALTPEQKMHDWWNGTRNENVKACGDKKLKLYFDICVENNYHPQADILKAEAKSRGLSWADGKILPVLHEIDFMKEDFEDVESLSPQEIENKHAQIARARRGLTIMIFAMMLRRFATVDVMLKILNDNFELSKADCGKIIRNAMADPEIIAVLNDLTPKNEALTEEKLYEAPEKHDTLNPKLWDETTLKPEVKEKIMTIVDDFCHDLENDEIKFKLKDVKLVGSNCSYNYNDKSDLDVHLVMDTKSLSCPDNLYPLLYSAYRSLWNKNHDVNFYGIPVEIFVETDDTEDMNEARQKTALKSNGVYSVMNDSWIKVPVAEDIPEIDNEAFEKLFSEWEDRYFAIKETPDKETIEKFIEDIYDLRKASIADDGEYGLGNLTFKECRNLGYLDNLRDIKKDLISKELSLN